MGAGWGSLILVSRNWADVEVRVWWEPDAGTGRAIWGLVREDFIDGPRWVRWQCGIEITELSCMDRPR